MTGDPARQPAATVLVVDDDPAIRRLLALTRADFGHRCREAGDAAAARRRLAEEPVDLGLYGNATDRALHPSGKAQSQTSPDAAAAAVSALGDRGAVWIEACRKTMPQEGAP